VSALDESFQLGDLAVGVEARLAGWVSSGRVGDLKRKNRELWPLGDTPDRLGWLNLPGSSQKLVDDLEVFAEEVRSEGIEHVILLGMGGSSLAPEVFSGLFGGRGGWPALVTLDTTHPGAVARALASLDPGKTLVVVASKSGTTVETLSLFRSFWTAFGEGSRFVAITDPGTALETVGKERQFRRVFSAPADVGGRFSALSVFGLAPAALVGADLRSLLATSLRVASELGDAGSREPALALGSLLVEAMEGGRDKLTLLAEPAIQPLADWLEQLTAESLGKKGVGVVPVTREPLGSIDAYGDDRVFVAHRLGGRADEVLSEFLDEARRRGHPVVERSLADPYEVGAEMYRWQVAVALAAADLGLNPFDQPDVDLAKVLARKAMERSSSVSETGAASVTASNFEERLRAWLADAAPGDYLCVQAFLDPAREVETGLRLLQGALRDHTRLAVCAGYGPRFLHSTGQLHKGGPKRGVFLQLIDRPAEDVPVAETDFTFSRLIAAQAEGDGEALVERGRRLLRVDLGTDAVTGLRQLREIMTRPVTR